METIISDWTTNEWVQFNNDAHMGPSNIKELPQLWRSLPCRLKERGKNTAEVAALAKCCTWDTCHRNLTGSSKIPSSEIHWAALCYPFQNVPCAPFIRRLIPEALPNGNLFCCHLLVKRHTHVLIVEVFIVYSQVFVTGICKKRRPRSLGFERCLCPLGHL